MRRDRPLAAAALVAAALAAGAALRAAPPAPKAPLRFGVVSFYSPRLMYLKYQPLVDYLSRTTGAPWELVLSRSYEEATERLCKAELLLAYLGPATFLRASQRCGAAPIACLRTGGKETYESWIMVREDSPVRMLHELRGKRFGFGDPFSTSSHIVPHGMLVEAGIHPGRDLTCVYFGHHERGAQAVLTGEVDACALRDIVGAKFKDRGLRLIAVSRPIPNFPLVLSPLASAEERRQIRKALLEGPRDDPKARATFASWDEELAGGFGECRTADFDGMADLERKLFGARAFSLKEKDIECRGPGR